MGEGERKSYIYVITPLRLQAPSRIASRQRFLRAIFELLADRVEPTIFSCRIWGCARPWLVFEDQQKRLCWIGVREAPLSKGAFERIEVNQPDSWRFFFAEGARLKWPEASCGRFLVTTSELKGAETQLARAIFDFSRGLQATLPGCFPESDRELRVGERGLYRLSSAVIELGPEFNRPRYRPSLEQPHPVSAEARS